MRILKVFPEYLDIRQDGYRNTTYFHKKYIPVRDISHEHLVLHEFLLQHYSPWSDCKLVLHKK
jgi:hypothetical protein